MKSVPITTKVVRSNPGDGEGYSIKHNVIKFLSDLRQVGGFLRVLLFPPPIHDISDIVENDVKHHADYTISSNKKKHLWKFFLNYHF